MLRIFRYSIFFIVSITLPIYSQEKRVKLEENEIRNSREIRFNNRSTRRAAVSTKRNNENVGHKLADLIENDPQSSHTLKGVKAIRIPAKDGQLGGDILFLEYNTNFGHVNSILRVISAYIEKSFDFNEDNADIIARYVLYYNAMHRGEKSYFKKKFVPELVDKLRPETTGIGVNYRDWAGKTQIVIPSERNLLRENNKDVSLDELSEEVNKIIGEKKNGPEDKKKFEEIKTERKEEDKKELVEKLKDIETKEDKLEKKEKETEVKLDGLKEDPNANKTEIAKLEEKKAEIVKEKQELATEKKELTGKEPAPAPVKTEEKPAVKVETKIAKEEKPVEVVAKKEEVPSKAVEEKKAVEKELAVVKDQLAKKEEAEKKKKEFSENVIDGKIVFLRTIQYIPDGHYNNEIHLLDPEKEDSILKSEFNKICGRTFKEFGGNILVVGFKDGHKDEHQLYLIGKADLKPIGRSDANVFSRTPLEINGEDLYAFEADKGRYYLSKFDSSLKRVAKSDTEISPDSNITFYAKKIYITGKPESGQADIRVFNKDDLKLIKKIQP